jgi:hypothetical protein
MRASHRPVHTCGIILWVLAFATFDPLVQSFKPTSPALRITWVWFLISSFRHVRMLRVIFWVVLRHVVFNGWRFGTLCLFHLHRRVEMNGHIHSPMKMEPTQCSKTSAIKHHTQINNPKDYTQQWVRFIFTTVLTLVSILSGCWTSGFGSPKRIFLKGGPNSSWTGVLPVGTNAEPIPSRYCSALQIRNKFLITTPCKITFLQHHKWGKEMDNMIS